jgi:uncharacterized protein (TIGR02001 family)
VKRQMSLLFGVALLGSTVAASAADVAGNVALVSDYQLRGISQNDGGFSPAIQGGFDWSSELGFYVGTWASNVNFSEGSIETDVYGGYKGMIVGFDDLGIRQVTEFHEQSALVMLGDTVTLTVLRDGKPKRVVFDAAGGYP